MRLKAGNFFSFFKLNKFLCDFIKASIFSSYDGGFLLHITRKKNIKRTSHLRPFFISFPFHLFDSIFMPFVKDSPYSPFNFFLSLFPLFTSYSISLLFSTFLFSTELCVCLLAFLLSFKMEKKLN